MTENTELVRALIVPQEGKPYTTLVGRKTCAEYISAVVKGHFDCVRSEKAHAYVNDEGLLLGLPINAIATAYFGRIIAGNAIMFGSFSAKGEYDGEEHHIDPEVLAVISNLKSAYELWEDASKVRSQVEDYYNR
jgi:hypothetical protein